MVAILIAMSRTGQARDLYVSLVTLGITLVAYMLVRAGRAAAVKSAPSS
jgi:hypothetical protein